MPIPYVKYNKPPAPIGTGLGWPWGYKLYKLFNEERITILFCGAISPAPSGCKEALSQNHKENVDTLSCRLQRLRPFQRQEFAYLFELYVLRVWGPPDKYTDVLTVYMFLICVYDNNDFYPPGRWGDCLIQSPHPYLTLLCKICTHQHAKPTFL